MGLIFLFSLGHIAHEIFGTSQKTSGQIRIYLEYHSLNEVNL